MKDQNKISYNSFKAFLEIIEYNYPYQMSTYAFMLQTKDYLVNLKREILDNIIFLKDENKTAYLNKLLFDLELEYKHAHTTKKEIDLWLTFNNISMEEVLKANKSDNELIQFITSEPVSFIEKEKEGYNPQKEEIQKDFYNYFYGLAINEAIEFINEQFDTIQEAETFKTSKLKTNLSVPELATLFRELNKLKPDIFDIKSKTELHRFISNNFTSKKQDNISKGSIKNNFDTPDSKAADFWIENMYTIIDNLKKTKEK